MEPIRTFNGQSSRPDPAESQCRRLRNAAIGPGGTWLETRPGSKHLAPETRMGIDGIKGDEDYIYTLQDDDIGGPVLISATPMDGHPVGSGLQFYGIASPSTSPVVFPGIAAKEWPMGSYASADELLLFRRTNSPLASAIGDGPNWVGCRDQYGLQWIGIVDAGDLDIYYINADNELSDLIGTIEDYDRAYGIGFLGGAGCYILNCEDEMATLYAASPNGVTEIGPVTGVTWGLNPLEYSLPHGLQYTTERDLWFMVRKQGSPNTYCVVVLNNDTAAARAGFPANTEVVCDESGAPCGTTQIDGEGFCYFWAREVGGVGGQTYIYLMTISRSGFDDLEVFIDTAVIMSYAEQILSMSFVVDEVGNTCFVASSSEGRARAFLFDIDEGYIELSTNYSTSGVDPFNPSVANNAAVFITGQTDETRFFVMSGGLMENNPLDGFPAIRGYDFEGVTSFTYHYEDSEVGECGGQTSGSCNCDLDGFNLGYVILQTLITSE